MLASELIKTYEEFCPQELSMEGDVVGLQIGSLDKEIQKVMVTLDVRENTVAEAIEKGVDLIIAKHAPIFRPVKDLVSSPDRDILLDLVKHDIAVYVSHTNIDVVRQKATPRATTSLSTAKQNRISALSASGYSTSEIAEALGVSTSTVSKYLNGKE